MYKELTTSVVPKCTDNNKPCGDLLIITQYMLHLRFDSDRDSIGNHTCRNLVIHMDMLSLHLSTAQIDDFVLPMIYVSERDFTHVWRVGLGSLRKPDLMLQALLSHHRVFLIPFPEGNTLNNPIGNLFGRARLYLLGSHPLMNSVLASVFTLCHGHGLWI